MWQDPIVEEIRAVRQAHAARFGFDLDAIVADLRRQQEEHRDKIVTLPPRRTRTATEVERARA